MERKWLKISFDGGFYDKKAVLYKGDRGHEITPTAINGIVRYMRGERSKGRRWEGGAIDTKEFENPGEAAASEFGVECRIVVCSRGHEYCKVWKAEKASKEKQSIINEWSDFSPNALLLVPAARTLGCQAQHPADFIAWMRTESKEPLEVTETVSATMAKVLSKHPNALALYRSVMKAPEDGRPSNMRTIFTNFKAKTSDFVADAQGAKDSNHSTAVLNWDLYIPLADGQEGYLKANPGLVPTWCGAYGKWSIVDERDVPESKWDMVPSKEERDAAFHARQEAKKVEKEAKKAEKKAKGRSKSSDKISKEV
jgi:hypothetical protein